MATRTPWVCSWLFLALILPEGCRRQAPTSTIQGALKAPGGPGEKAKALLWVASAKTGPTQREAFYLAGLYACDAGSPASALAAFSRAKPEGGRAFLALRRLEEACSRRPPPGQLLGRYLAEPWLGPGGVVRLAVTSAKAALLRGDRDKAQELVALAEGLSQGSDLPWLHVLHAACWPEEASFHQQQLLLQSPQLLEETFPHLDLQKLTQGFTKPRWRQLAQAWLAAGEPAKALQAAQRAGEEGAETAAKACLLLRRSQGAESWALRLPLRSPQRYLLLAQALRQGAWSAQGVARAQLFARAERAARQAVELAQGAERAEALVLWAEALVERGQLGEVSWLLKQAASATPPRWEWVARRALLLAAARGESLQLPLDNVGPRLARIARFWKGFLAWRQGDGDGLRQLVASGHPDLPSLWAARLLGEPLNWRPGEAPVEVPPPPPWSRWLLTAGRVADVLVGWRAELEASSERGPAWLGLVQLGQFPPRESIPLLVRAEPRLLSGPWHGVSRQLLRQYLPLPYAQEIAQAAQAYGIPPWFLAAVVRQESAFDPSARSPKGAIGLAQLLPQTVGISASKLTEPRENLRAGARVLARLLASFQGAWEPTLAAYNAGERRIRSAWENAGRQPGASFVEALELPETWDYVHRVMLFAQGYKALYWPSGEPERGGK